MSEHIVETFGIVQDFADLHGDMNTPLYQAIMDVMVSRQREEIVRCRDCLYRRGNWNGKHPAASDWFFCAYWGGHEITNPDGFCAWGEKVESETTDYFSLFIKCSHETGGRCTRENEEIGKCCYERDGSCEKVEGML